MALAIIEHEGADRGELLFRVEIGKNRFYSYAVGDGAKSVVTDGFRMLGDTTHHSELFGPVPRSSLGRAVLRVPEAVFQQGENPTIQLISFMEEDMTGPAPSSLLRVRSPMAYPDRIAPPAGFALAVDTPDIRVVPFMAEQQGMSTAMFLEALMGIIPKLLPAVTNFLQNPATGNLLGGLLGGLTGGAGGAGAQPSPAVAAVTKPENLKLLAELLQGLLGQVGTTPGAQTKSLNGTNGNGGVALSLSSEPTPHLATAQWAQLLAALPALMPLLEKVLSPETIKSVLDTADPNKLIGTISDAVAKLGKLGLEGQKQEMEHLERLNPGTKADDLERLMTGMGLSRSLAVGISKTAKEKSDYRRVDVVQVQFADLSLQQVAGRPVAAFVTGRELRFPLTLETPRPIRNATLVLDVKDARTLKPIVKRSYRVAEAHEGRLDPVPTLTPADAARLVAGEDYLVCASLKWRTKSKQTLGTTKTQLITMVGPYAFDRIEQTTEVVPLNDVVTYRDFWHKAWEGKFSRDRRKLVFSCRYHYALDTKSTTNAQMQTETDTEPAANERHEVGRLKSGLVMSIYVLNRLTDRISSHAALNEEELAALRTRDFADRFSQAARTQVSVRGRDGEAAAIWLYPEVKLQRVVLRRAEDVNNAGHVLRFGEHPVHFPMPVLAHFIGVASQ